MNEVGEGLRILHENHENERQLIFRASHVSLSVQFTSAHEDTVHDVCLDRIRHK